MTLEAKATMLAILAAGLAFVLQVWSRSRTSTRPNAPGGFPVMIALSLASVALALIVVGVVSGTLRTPLVQIAPLVPLLACLPRSRAWIPMAAAAVLSWWLVTMAAIWLFLLGLSRFLTGRFSPAEIFLTLVIGMACLVGALSERPSRIHAAQHEPADDRARRGAAVTGAVGQLSTDLHRRMTAGEYLRLRERDGFAATRAR